MNYSRRHLTGLALFLLAALAAAPLFLSWMGRFLIVQDPVASGDAIIVLAGNRIERVFEAGTLYRERRAPRIFLSRPAGSEDTALARSLGVRMPSYNDLQRMVLEQMGVPGTAIENMGGPIFNTRDEARVLTRIAIERNYRRVIVTTSPYHSRRARIYFRRAARGRFEVDVRPSRYDRVDPSEWWRRPYDRVDVVLEWMKLPRVVFSRP